MTASLPSFMTTERAANEPWMDWFAQSLRQGIETYDWSFSCTDRDRTFELTAEELTARDGFLPVLLHHTNTLVEKELGHAFPLAFRENDRAMCSAVPEMNGPTASLPVWLCFTLFALEQWVTAHPELKRDRKPVPIDALVNHWEEARAQRLIVLMRPLDAPRPSLNAPVA